MCTDDAIPYSQALDHVYASGEHPALFDQICAYWKLEAMHILIKSLRDMLPYFSNSGHNNYTKLEETEPSVYMKFLEGQFVLRHSVSYWSGIFSDLCIEQVLMGSIKSVGGRI